MSRKTYKKRFSLFTRAAHKACFLGVMGKVRRTDMKASEIKEKMSKISKNDISSFFQKNWKYFTAVILFVVLAVVMIKFSSGNKDKDNGLSTEQSTESENFQVDAVPGNQYPDAELLQCICGR